MPRRYPRRRPASNRSRYAPRRRYGGSKPAKRRFKRYARKIVRTTLEKKYHLVQNARGSATSFDLTTPFVEHLTGITIGDTDQTRDGNQISLRSIEIHARIGYNEQYSPSSSLGPWAAAQTEVSELVRFIVFQWLPHEDPDSFTSTPDLSRILLDVLNRPTDSPYAHDTRRDFRILYDKKHRVITVPTSIAGQPAYWNTDFRIRIKRFVRRGVVYSTVTTPPAPLSNAVYMAAVTDWQTDMTHSPFVMNYTVKTNFSDM